MENITGNQTSTKWSPLFSCRGKLLTVLMKVLLLFSAPLRALNVSFLRLIGSKFGARSKSIRYRIIQSFSTLHDMIDLSMSCLANFEQLFEFRATFRISGNFFLSWRGFILFETITFKRLLKFWYWTLVAFIMIYLRSSPTIWHNDVCFFLSDRTTNGRVWQSCVMGTTTSNKASWLRWEAKKEQKRIKSEKV